MKKIFALLAMALLSGTAWADGTLDGVVGAGYGAAVATDPTGTGEASPGGSNIPVMDLSELYVTDSGSDVYVAVKIAGDIVATNWGNYMMYIQTDNQTTTATNGNGNGWNRPINPGSTNYKPKYWLGSWVNGTGGAGAQLWSWNGTSWGQDATSPDANLGLAWTANVVEYRISKAALGNPNKVSVIAMSSGGGGGDTAIDTVPSAYNATGWSDAVVLDPVIAPTTVPVELSAFEAM